MLDAGDAATAVVVVADGSEAVVGRLEGAVDFATVDVLLRLQLRAGRRGACVRLREPSAQVRALLAFAGLAEVLGLEPGGQPELGEQLGEDEVAQRRDATA